MLLKHVRSLLAWDLSGFTLNVQILIFTCASNLVHFHVPTLKIHTTSALVSFGRPEHKSAYYFSRLLTSALKILAYFKIYHMDLLS